MRRPGMGCKRGVPGIFPAEI